MRPSLPGKLLFCWLLLAFMALLSPAPVSAQYYHVQTYRCQDGAPSNIVFNAAQDSKGNMWFASRVGLNIFDGLSWKDAAENDPAGPRGEGFVSIDANNNVWWASKRLPLRICRLVEGQWEQLPSAGSIDLGWDTVGLQAFTNAQGISTVVVASRSGFLRMWDGEKWITPAGDAPGRLTFSMELDRSNLLISTANGLVVINLESPHEPTNISFGLPDGAIFATASSPENSMIWVVGKRWVARVINQKLDKIFPIPKSGAPIVKSPTSACQDPNGGLYYVDFSRTIYFHPQVGFENLTLNSGLATDDGNWVMMDREKNIWITSNRGISKIISRRLACYDRNHGLLEDEVSSIIQRASGAIVLGHRNGLTFFEPELKTLTFKTKPSTIHRVIDMAEDKQGNLWIAAYRKGLGRLKEDGSIQWYGKAEGLSLPVYSILHHPDHGLFVGTSEGLFHQVGSRFEMIVLPGIESKHHPYIRRLTLLSTGTIAMATGHNGVFFWNNGEISHFPGDEINGTNGTYTVFENPGGDLWVGASSGLFEVKDNSLKKIESHGPVIDRPIYAITQGCGNNVWFGTDEGVIIWDGKKQSRLTTREGLLGNETNRDAIMKDEDGHIWIGTESGLSIYRREHDTPHRITPILAVTGIKINGEPYPVDQPITVDGPLGSLQISVHAPHFASDQKLKFRVRQLDNSDVSIPVMIQWPGLISLTNVPPGIFQIEIQAKTNDDLETNIVTTPLITIVPPILQRWYSRAAMIAGSIFILWLAFAFFSGRRYAKKLEDEVRIQTHDLRDSEEKARLESERLARTLESISEGLVVINGLGNVVLSNQAAENMFAEIHLLGTDCTLEKILPVQSLVDPKQASLYKQLLDNPAGIRFLSERVPVRHPDQQITWLEISAVPISGSPGGVVFAFRDITNRRKAEQEKQRSQKLESLGLMAGGIAHDFNNLLAIMLGNLSLAESTLIKTSVESRQLGKIRSASERAQRLTQQLLTFAKGGRPVRQPVNIAAILTDSISFSLSGSNVTCHMEIPDDLWWASVDGNQISQVFGNLLINAFQAMPDGGEIIISAENILEQSGSPEEMRKIKISIQDCGPGISDNDKAQIFDPYFTTKEKGTGLGLAIAHSVMVKHGGALSVESKLGHGSTFSMVLPACDPVLEPTPAPGIPGTLTAATSLNVLYMDDEEDILIILESMLDQLGHKGFGVADGEAALAAFSKAEKTDTAFDLVILDLTIPGKMGGKETIQKLQTINSEVPVIVASGYSNDQVIANFREYGFSGILRKPFTTNDLEKVLDESF